MTLTLIPKETPPYDQKTSGNIINIDIELFDWDRSYNTTVP